MIRNSSMILAMCAAVAPAVVRADVVTDWNTTLNQAIIATPSKHNPGNPTRAAAMMNAAIYDVFQAVNRTHAPFKVNLSAPGADLNAAVARAAYLVIKDTYGEQQGMLDTALDARLGAGPFTPAQQAGIALGNEIGQHYVNAHADDNHNLPDQYTPTVGVRHWAPDPMITPDQKGWGSDWGFVTPWTMPNSDYFDGLISLPAMDSQEYVNAFNQVKDFGARISPSRTDDQTKIGIFWAYDRPNLPGKPGVGPPPVLFSENMIEIGQQAGNTPAENARMFAMASVAQADAAIAAWDVKYETDHWRPISAIRANAAMDDDNPATVEDPNWAYLGAPGFDPNSAADDFTPPFPSYTSGHATMGGAIFKSLELFFGTNNFDEIDGILGNNPSFTLHSNEPDGGGPRNYTRFTQTVPLTAGTENSPEGENGMSRVYLGVHWLFDQTDGITLGNAIAAYAAANHFQAVPEPSAMLLVLIGAVSGAFMPRRKR